MICESLQRFSGRDGIFLGKWKKILRVPLVLVALRSALWKKTIIYLQHNATEKQEFKLLVNHARHIYLEGKEKFFDS